MAAFLRSFALFCLVLGGLIYALRAAFGAAVVHPLTPYTFGYLALLTLVTYWVTHRLVQASPDNFMGAYFGSMLLRLLLSLALVTVHLYRGGSREGSGTLAFLGGFFALYFLFAGFEIRAILSNLRPFSDKQAPEKQQFTP